MSTDLYQQQNWNDPLPKNEESFHNTLATSSVLNIPSKKIKFKEVRTSRSQTLSDLTSLNSGSLDSKFRSISVGKSLIEKNSATRSRSTVNFNKRPGSTYLYFNRNKTPNFVRKRPNSISFSYKNINDKTTKKKIDKNNEYDVIDEDELDDDFDERGL